MFGVDLALIIATAVWFVLFVFVLALCRAAARGDEIASRADVERRRREAMTRASGGSGWRRL